jgi:hypothetical protein
MPKKFDSGEHLACFICRIDPYLLTADALKIHELLGEDENGKNWVSLRVLRKLMNSEKYIKERKELIERHFADELQLISLKSRIKLAENIDAGNMDAIKVGLQMTGDWLPGHRQIKTDEKAEAKRMAKLLGKYFDWDKVKKLGGNH